MNKKKAKDKIEAAYALGLYDAFSSVLMWLEDNKHTKHYPLGTYRPYEIVGKYEHNLFDKPKVFTEPSGVYPKELRHLAERRLGKSDIIS